MSARKVIIFVLCSVSSCSVFAKIDYSVRMNEVYSVLTHVHGTTNVLEGMVDHVTGDVLTVSERNSCIGKMIHEYRKSVHIIKDKHSPAGAWVNIERNENRYLSLKHIFDQSLQSECVDPYWRENFSVLFAAIYGDYSYLEQYGVSFDRGYFSLYCYQPVKGEHLPLDAERWEKLILSSLMKGHQRDRNQLYSKGYVTGVSVSEIRAILWLARFGQSEETRNYLLEMPLARCGWLNSMQRMIPFNKKNPSKDYFLFEKGGHDSWIEWYVSEVIIPAGLLTEFRQRVHEQENSISLLRDELE